MTAQDNYNALVATLDQKNERLALVYAKRLFDDLKADETVTVEGARITEIPFHGRGVSALRIFLNEINPRLQQ